MTVSELDLAKERIVYESTVHGPVLLAYIKHLEDGGKGVGTWKPRALAAEPRLGVPHFHTPEEEKQLRLPQGPFCWVCLLIEHHVGALFYGVPARHYHQFLSLIEEECLEAGPKVLARIAELEAKLNPLPPAAEVVSTCDDPRCSARGTLHECAASEEFCPHLEDAAKCTVCR